MRPFKFMLYKDRAKQWRWRIVAGNGRIVAVSGEGFCSKRNARRSVKRVNRILSGWVYVKWVG